MSYALSAPVGLRKYFLSSTLKNQIIVLLTEKVKITRNNSDRKKQKAGICLVGTPWEQYF
ncbi:hypothetical protein D1164_03485 [Mariniphaga sediminis]|jgi:hypothetical protein|uniref:Uncharacterized protein n=1 Tax=Mariniphaga sediminis TaxID=1628158 RepID=A0A399D843_9BACT|nr:hypothetical protein [Mariniphaga sediminis]RIH66672.1 hypothetical protein D1164_03485 [Mariniphaga sediminis]